MRRSASGNYFLRRRRLFLQVLSLRRCSNLAQSDAKGVRNRDPRFHQGCALVAERIRASESGDPVAPATWVPAFHFFVASWSCVRRRGWRTCIEQNESAPLLLDLLPEHLYLSVTHLRLIRLVFVWPCAGTFIIASLRLCRFDRYTESHIPREHKYMRTQIHESQ